MLFQIVVNNSYYRSAIVSLLTRITSLLFARNNILVAEFGNWNRANGPTELHIQSLYQSKLIKEEKHPCSYVQGGLLTVLHHILKWLNTYFNSTEWSDDKWTFMVIKVATLVSAEVNRFSEIFNWINWKSWWWSLAMNLIWCLWCLLSIDQTEQYSAPRVQFNNWW